MWYGSDIHFPVFFPRLWLKQTYKILNAGWRMGEKRPMSIDLRIHLVELSSFEIEQYEIEFYKENFTSSSSVKAS